jgi:3'(2'), 5'-bisphosphate nucleotidase
MDKRDIEFCLDCAIAAAFDAGRAIMDIYRKEITVEFKTDKSPLTEADKQSNSRIVQRLSTNTAGLPILSEEDSHDLYERRCGWPYFWMIDPLDGTKEFIKRNGEFTVNIALIKRQDPVAGVVFAPAKGELYAGITGVGAWRCVISETGFPSGVKEMREKGTRLPFLKTNTRQPSYTIVASRSHHTAETEWYIKERRREYPDLELVSAGSSLKICRVAEGSADEYPRFAPTMEWDTAAGDAVARAADCDVYVWDAAKWRVGGPLKYNKKDLRNPWFLVQRRDAGTGA